jgi:hypothetical protein
VSQALVAFYQGTSPDPRGRSLVDLWALDHEAMERSHDSIQWLFPTATPSRNHPTAPVLDAESISVFRQSPEMRERLLRSLRFMLDFYGLSMISPQEIGKAEHYQQRQKVWQSELNHNYLRLTRILESLRLLGLESYSLSLYSCLEAIRNEVPWRIPLLTLTHWRRAAGLPGKPRDLSWLEKITRIWR